MEQTKTIPEIGDDIIKILLSDKTTKKYIRWGSDNYMDYGPEYHADQEIKPELISGNKKDLIQPRILKSEEEKSRRTRDKAEVFTPSWVCNEQNNLVDAAWFGREGVFTVNGEKSWIPVPDPVAFPRDKIWKDYIDARRMEVSCGEAPYLVSRYDTVSGEMIQIQDRIGLLDRKLRVVNENAKNDAEWLQWAIRALQSCYGYDFSGDNVLLARKNILYTFMEYMEAWTGKYPTAPQLKKAANIISWNIWQMNGISMTAPYSTADPAFKQITLFDLFDMGEEKDGEEKPGGNEVACKIFDWRSNESIEFRSMVKGG